MLFKEELTLCLLFTENGSSATVINPFGYFRSGLIACINRENSQFSSYLANIHLYQHRFSTSIKLAIW